MLASWIQGNIYELKSSGTLSIKGSSSLHDWESAIQDFEIDAKLDLINKKGDIRVTVVGESIKSGKVVMDQKTYESLRTDEYPEISFISDSLEFISNGIIAHGNLTIAGNTRPASIVGNYTSDNEGVIVSGIYRLRMSDFGIDPPTAMFGSLETEDEVSIFFNVQLPK